MLVFCTHVSDKLMWKFSSLCLISGYRLRWKLVRRLKQTGRFKLTLWRAISTLQTKDHYYSFVHYWFFVKLLIFCQINDFLSNYWFFVKLLIFFVLPLLFFQIIDFSPHHLCKIMTFTYSFPQILQTIVIKNVSFHIYHDHNINTLACITVKFSD